MASRRQMQIINFVRREHASDLRFGAIDDDGALMIHFAECAADLRAGALSDEGKFGALRTMLNHAAYAFGELGHSPEDSRLRAEAAVGDIAPLPLARLAGAL